MENCNRHNSEMVSRIHLKVGTGIDQRSDVTPRSRGHKSRSQGHVTYSNKNCNNSVMGGPINFIVGGWHMDDPSTSGAQTGCHSNAGCLATGPRNL